MKTIISNHGLRTPKFIPWLSTLTFNDIAAKFGLPFIIKPIDSCGSHGVHKIHNETEYQQFCRCIGTSEYAIEEFIQGKLFHVDSLTKNGEIKFICANEYSHPNLDFTKGKPLASIPLDQHDPLAVRLIDFAKQCLHALKANNIVNHMELFVTDSEEIIFLEVSGRPPGSLVNYTHHSNFSVNLMDEDFFMQANVNLILNKKINRQKAFSVIFPLQAGTVKNCIPPTVQSHCEMTWFVKSGQEISPNECLNIVNKAAIAIISHDDINILREDFNTVKNHNALEMLAC